MELCEDREWTWHHQQYYRHSSYMYLPQASSSSLPHRLHWHMSSSLGSSTQRMQPTRPSDGTWKRKPHSPQLLVRYRGATLVIVHVVVIWCLCTACEREAIVLCSVLLNLVLPVLRNTMFYHVVHY